MNAFKRGFEEGLRGGRPSPVRALIVAASAGGAVAAAVYRLLRR